MTITTTLTAIGNSQGVRIPQQMLQEADLTDRVTLEVRGNSVVVTAIAKSKQRVGWDATFSQASADTTKPMIEIKDHSWDDQEWEW